jgi:hypothetical protein
MQKLQKSYKLDKDVVELHQTIKSIGGVSEGKIIEALTHYVIDHASLNGFIDYITTLEFKDGRKKNGDGS